MPEVHPAADRGILAAAGADPGQLRVWVPGAAGPHARGGHGSVAGGDPARHHVRGHGHRGLRGHPLHPPAALPRPEGGLPRQGGLGQGGEAPAQEEETAAPAPGGGAGQAWAPGDRGATSGEGRPPAPPPLPAARAPGKRK